MAVSTAIAVTKAHPSPLRVEGEPRRIRQPHRIRHFFRYFDI
jgi:hypothetical protein